MYKPDCCPACGKEVLSPYFEGTAMCPACGQEFAVHDRDAFFLYYPEFPIGY